jgi:hypothetical protein
MRYSIVALRCQEQFNSGAQPPHRSCGTGPPPNFLELAICTTQQFCMDVDISNAHSTSSEETTKMLYWTGRNCALEQFRRVFSCAVLSAYILKTRYDQPGLLRYFQLKKLLLAHPDKEDIASAVSMYPEINSNHLYIQLTMMKQQQWNVDSLQLVGKFSSMEPAVWSLLRCGTTDSVTADCALQQHLGRAKLLDIASLENICAKLYESTTAEPCSCSERAQRASRQTGPILYSKWLRIKKWVEAKCIR